MKANPEYCPLCGANQLEWYKGEADDETILEFKEMIKELYEKVKKEN